MSAAGARPRATLRPRGGPKPLDAGTGVVCASFAADGGWLSLGTVHSVHGFVELSAVPPLDDSWRTDPMLVRRYRAMLADDQHAFLAWAPEPAEAPRRMRARADRAGVAHERRYDGWSHRARVLPGISRRGLVQQHLLRARDNQPNGIVLTARGRLDRPALGEITELEAPPPTGAVTAWQADGSRLHIVAARLPATAWVAVEGVEGVAWEVGAESARLAIPWPAGESVLRFRIECGITEEPA